MPIDPRIPLMGIQQQRSRDPMRDAVNVLQMQQFQKQNALSDKKLQEEAALEAEINALPPAEGGGMNLPGMRDVLLRYGRRDDALKLEQMMGQQQERAGKPPTSRTVKRGDREVLQEWNPQTRAFVDVSEAPRWDPNAGTRVEVNTGSTMPQVGTIPQGFQLVQTKEGGWTMAAIPGGPADIEAQDKNAKQAMREEQTQSAGSVVLEDIGRAKELVTKNPRLTTGILGPVLAAWGGTDAADVKALVDTISANISFDRINQMRQASPTGGALGQVTERELALLSASAGSLSQSQSADQFVRNLERLEKQFSEVVNGSKQSRVPFQAVPSEGGDLPRPQTTQEAMQLPPGTKFISPDGKVRVRP